MVGTTKTSLTLQQVLQMSSAIITELMEIRSRIDDLIEGGGSSSGSTSGKKGRAKKEKKASTRKGRPTAHGDFTKKICEEHKAEVDAFTAQLKESIPDKKGAHFMFVSQYKKEHMDEYKAFEETWKEAHPKDATASDAGSEAEGSATEGGAEAVAKPKRVVSDEQKAAMKAGREKAAAARKEAKAAEEAAAKEGVPLAPVAMAEPKPAAVPVAAKKQVKTAKKADAAEPTPVAVIAAPVPVAEPKPVAMAEPKPVEEEDGENEFLPFKKDGANYMRLGIKREDGNHVWATGDLWASKKGARGNYIGCLGEDGIIDTDAEEPQLE